MRPTIFTTIFCLRTLTQGLAIPKRQNTDMVMPAVSEPPASISAATKPAIGSTATLTDPIHAGGQKTASGIPIGASISPAGTPADPSTAKGGEKAPGVASDITGPVGLGLGSFLTPAGAITSSVAAGSKMGGLKREEEKTAADAIMEAPSALTIPTVPGLDAENGLGRTRKPGNIVDAGAPHGPKKAPGPAASTADRAVGLGLGGFLTPAGAITSTVAAGLKGGGL
ncbi:hypothetical protein DID88_010370 [Monilinia fructigena]|uniref:Uncharacterized protein n=1 Tax=Monilinia fructigena TaxID=38457 RepID=A0A395IMA8_9HELO|nr:hypothetical protein DID88_010370 [Monilinia fructigena]